MNLQQRLVIRYNKREVLEKYFPRENFGIADRLLLNRIIQEQKVLGFESYGKIMKHMEQLGYKIPKTYKLN
ncbi:MAG: hypothetical protein WCX73_02390 [Candidatus Pacearchaeota archaeon]|jgi:hypothetical protein